jgi:transposase
MQRRRFDTAFKGKVALEAIKEDLTIAELSNKYSVGPTQIKAWKAELLRNIGSVFEKGGKKAAPDNSETIAALERKVGQQAIQIDFLKKNLLKFPGMSD